MKSNIFIPEKINVGFQKREDTYTQKLAYVIYFDQKGVLRKETSWNSWRDKKIENQIFTNEKTSGFVLNKKVGDYRSDWNHRMAHVRVYDPRDFEFEITVENLLYILENTSSIKGKGLEGEFVYGWDGKDLILIPVDSPDYKEIAEFNALVHSNTHIKAKELILGATYRHKNGNNYIYMGKFDYWENEWVNDAYVYTSKGQKFYFVRVGDEKSVNRYNLLCVSSPGDKFLECLSSNCHDDYASIFGRIEKLDCYSPVDPAQDKYFPFTLPEFFKKVGDRYGWGGEFYDSEKRRMVVQHFDKEAGTAEVYPYRPNRGYWDKFEIVKDKIEALFERYKPMYRNKYLKNGKLHESGKENER